MLSNKKEAFEYLSKAIAAGYSNYSHIQEDKDLDNLRNDKVFQNTIEPLRAIGESFTYITLMPLEYFDQKNESTIVKNKKNNFVFT